MYTSSLSHPCSTYFMTRPFADNMNFSWKILSQCHFRGSLYFTQCCLPQSWHFLQTVHFCLISAGKELRWHGLLSSRNITETWQCGR
jgi:hypothetical protein